MADATCRRGRTFCAESFPAISSSSSPSLSAPSSCCGGLLDRAAAGPDDRDAAARLARILPPRDHRRRLGPERRRGISAGRLQHAVIGRQRRMSARARFVAGSDGSAKSACRDRRHRPAARPLRLRTRHRGDGTVQLRSLLRHAQRARTGRRGHPDRRRPRRTLCLHQDVLPAAQGLVPLLKLAATVPKSRFQCARKLLGWTADGLDPR